MDITFTVYFEDEERKILCPTCAIKKVIHENKKVSFGVEEYDEDRSIVIPQCSVCDQYIKVHNL